MSTMILGLGNLILSDDGLGVRALRRLMDDPRLPPDVVLVDGGTLGLELLSLAAGSERLIVLDAVDHGRPPGSAIRLSGAELGGLPGGGSVHQLGLIDLLHALRLLGQEPAEVVLLGLQPERITLGTELTARVAAALDELVEAAVRECIETDGEGD